MSRRAAELSDLLGRLAKGLANPGRLALLRLVCQGAMTVPMLSQVSGQPIRLVSVHMRKLRQVRLVESRRRGRHIFYSVAEPTVLAIWLGIEDLDRLLPEFTQIVRSRRNHHAAGQIKHPMTPP